MTARAAQSSRRKRAISVPVRDDSAQPGRRFPIMLVLALVVAAALRFWDLSSVPPGLWPDEAWDANDAVRVASSGDVRVFYPENNGRETLYINVLAVAFKLFGPSVEVLRGTSAAIGVVTVAGVYLLTAELLGATSAGWAAFFLATVFWHVQLSRLGLRAVMVPLLVAFALWVLLRALRTGRWQLYALSGSLVGLGFHTYPAFRAVLPVAVVAFLARMHFAVGGSAALGFVPEWRAWARRGAVFLASALLVASPLLVYFALHPAAALSRADVTVFSEGAPPHSALVSFAKTVAMLHLGGDSNWRHNISGEPMLTPVVGGLFLIGLLVAFGRLRKGPEPWVLVGGWLIMLLPAALTWEGAPHSLRACGSLPFVAAIAGWGAEAAWTALRRVGRVAETAAQVGLVLILSCASFTSYFLDWGQRDETRAAFFAPLIVAGELARDRDVRPVVIVNIVGEPPGWKEFLSQTIDFVSQKSDGARLIGPEELQALDVAPGTVLLPVFVDRAVPYQIRRRWPTARVVAMGDRLLAFELR